ncbi:MAG: hypothetical protein ACJAZP_001405 [Psychromonas sp.]|jgi:hypothetical protein|uniref:hypothetical protein n=1 Tax=Psychromonas sp. TaxID=1884585 RepID=UPI0039E21C72
MGFYEGICVKLVAVVRFYHEILWLTMVRFSLTFTPLTTTTIYRFELGRTCSRCLSVV